jgi:pilus assembly protein CpaB
VQVRRVAFVVAWFAVAVLIDRCRQHHSARPAEVAPTRDAGDGLTSVVRGDMRAVAVHVDDIVGIAGFLHPEDRVDVVVTVPATDRNLEPTSKVILQNVKVLAIARDTQLVDGAHALDHTTVVFTLLVKPEEAEKLARAATAGRILLALRTTGEECSIPVGTD